MNGQRTNSAWKHGLIVDIALNPSHQVLDVCWRRHLSRSLVVLGVLPEVFKPITTLDYVSILAGQ